MTDRLGPYLLGPNNTPENGIYTGDARILAKLIPDESIDLIFTDPVYQNIDDYRWLAETAARVLINGGMLLAQTDQRNRLSAELAVLKSLKPLPLVAEVYPFAMSYTGFHNIMSGWKPYIWAYKGDKRKGRFAIDRHHGGGRDKSVHRWGDSPGFFSHYLSVLTELDAIVFDPFTGGGTVPAVCKMLERRYLAFEIDPDVAQTARERVRQTQMPLFVLEPEQMIFASPPHSVPEGSD